ncbi:hypothetical protein BMS3Abin04_01992 [bacterium BMS3Abin04]|nr:hypothetical protein BMS3Abin04_01992 [bacterium BMS3Abin04]
MFRKFFNLLIIIFINVFLLSGCFDAPNDFVVPSWDVKLHIPVANKTYTLKEAIDKDTTFVHSYTNPENLGLLYFGDNQPIEKITLGDNLSVDPFSASASEVIGPLTLNFPAIIQTGIRVEDWTTNVTSGSFQVFPEQEGTVTIGFKGYDKIKSATFDRGTLTITVINILPVPITLRGMEIRNAADQSIIADTSNAIKDWVGIPALSQKELHFDVSGKTVLDSIEYHGTIYSLGSNGQKVQVPSEAGTQIVAIFSNLIVSQATAVIPEQHINFKNRLLLDDSTKLESAEIFDGSASIAVTNNIDVDLNADITFDNLLDAGDNPYKLTVLFRGGEKTKLVQIPSLKGWKIVTADTSGNPSNEMNYSVDVTTVSSDVLVTISKNDSIALQVNFSKLYFQSISGQLKPTRFTFQPTNFMLDLGDFNNKFKFGSINFNSADLTLNLMSSANLDVEVNGKIIGTNGLQNSELLLQNVLLPSTQPVKLDLASLLNGFSEKLPDQFTVVGTSFVNPNYEVGSVTRDDSVYGNVNFEIPLDVGISGGEIVDTVEIDFGSIDQEDINKINYGKVTFIFQNEIPVSISFQGKVLDDNFNPVLNLPPSHNSISALTIPAPTVDQNGNVQNAGETTEQIELKGDDIQKFLNNPYLLIDFKFQTSGGNIQPVKFNINNKISFRIKAEAGYKLEF